MSILFKSNRSGVMASLLARLGAFVFGLVWSSAAWAAIDLSPNIRGNVGGLSFSITPSGGGGGGISQEAATLGDVICNLYINAGAFPYLLSVIAYVSGCFLAVHGFLLLKKHAEKPDDSQVVKATAHLIVGGILLSLPTFAGVLQRSVFGQSSAGGMLGGMCYGQTPSDIMDSPDLSQIWRNFVDNVYEPMLSLVAGLCIVIGLFLIAKGLYRAAKIGSDPKAAATPGLIAYFVIGAVLISSGDMMEAMFGTLFGTSFDGFGLSNFGINWSGISGDIDSDEADEVIRAVLRFVQIVGFISFLRGWMVLKNAVEGTGQATVPQGVTHIIGGAMAINIGVMIRIFDSTLGTGNILGAG